MGDALDGGYVDRNAEDVKKAEVAKLTPAQKLGEALWIHEDIVSATGWDDLTLTNYFNALEQTQKVEKFCSPVYLTSLITMSLSGIASFFIPGFLPLAIAAGVATLGSSMLGHKLVEQTQNLRIQVLGYAAFNTLVAPQMEAQEQAAAAAKGAQTPTDAPKPA